MTQQLPKVLLGDAMLHPHFNVQLEGEAKMRMADIGDQTQKRLLSQSEVWDAPDVPSGLNAHLAEDRVERRHTVFRCEPHRVSPLLWPGARHSPPVPADTVCFSCPCCFFSSGSLYTLTIEPAGGRRIDQRNTTNLELWGDANLDLLVDALSLYYCQSVGVRKTGEQRQTNGSHKDTERVERKILPLPQSPPSLPGMATSTTSSSTKTLWPFWKLTRTTSLSDSEGRGAKGSVYALYLGTRNEKGARP